VRRDLAILGVLGANMPGSSPMQPQLVLVHHTDCGMGRLASPPIQQQVAQRLGLSDDDVAAMAVTDPTATVQADIERLRQMPRAPGALMVSGLVYDVGTGTVNEVVSPAPLRVTA
jgi:carbonic anhydrase